MAPDPLHPHHPASDLEGSTSITPVTPDVMAHAAKHAADLVAGAASRSQAASSKGGRANKKAAQRSVAQDPASVETAPTAATEPQEAQPSAQMGVPEDEAVLASAALEPRSEARPATREEVASSDLPRVESVAVEAEDSIAEQEPALARFTALSARALRTNIDAAFEFWTSMMGAKSIPEAFSLNADFLRKQVETATAQARDLSALAQQMATKSVTRLTRLSDKS